MNTESAPPEPIAAAPMPQELADIDHRLGLDAPRRDEPHSGEGIASILRRLS